MLEREGRTSSTRSNACRRIRVVSWRVSNHFDSTASSSLGRITNLNDISSSAIPGMMATHDHECFVARGWDERCQRVMTKFAKHQLDALSLVAHQNVAPRRADGRGT